jgi:selenoprotein W-related protein
MAELVRQYEFRIEAIRLIPSDGGAFEVKVDDDLVYSKRKTGQHPQEGEIVHLVGERLR